jgi:hypothetical protein
VPSVPDVPLVPDEPLVPAEPLVPDSPINVTKNKSSCIGSVPVPPI